MLRPVCKTVLLATLGTVPGDMSSWVAWVLHGVATYLCSSQTH